MKKKGLIISTIVMVVVLIASLTTATYAWFSQSSKTTVDSLELQVNSAAAVAIGARASGTGASQNDYKQGQVTLGHNSTAGQEYLPTYSNGTTGLGTNLGFSTGGTLELQKAINTATSITTGESGTVTGATASNEKFNPQGKVIYAASSGANDTEVAPSSIAYAVANQDFVVLNMGAKAAQSGVYGIYATIKVSTTDEATTLKMMAAMHFYIRVYNSELVAASGNTPAHYTVDRTNYKWVEFDLFGSASENTEKSADALSGLTKPDANISYRMGDSSKNEDTSQVYAEFSFLVAGIDTYAANATALKTDGSEIFMFDIYAYIWGPDENCVSTATGSGAKFEIEFNKVGSETGTTAAPACITINTAGSVA